MSCLAFLLSSLVVSAQSVDATTARRIDADVEALRERYGVSSVAIEAIRDGRVVYAKAYGLRDKERKLPATTDTHYEIGSITKQFTAAAMLQLQEAGKLNIDQSLAVYLPNAPHAKEVTLRQLLTHTSGLHDYFDASDAEIDIAAAKPTTFEQLMGRIADKPLDFPPGSKWSYSNTNYILLGKVIELVSGESYRDYLQRHFFDPLEMKQTFTMAEEDRLQDMAIGYRHSGGELERAPRMDASWGGAAGFLVSTLSDLAVWDAALRGGNVVSAASYAMMTTPFMTSTAGSADYGLGLFVDSAYDQPRIGHTGGSRGSTTADEYFPRQKLRLIAFTNLGDDAPEAGEAVTNALFADLEPGPAAAAMQAKPGEVQAVNDAARASFVELEAGSSYAHFGAKLEARLESGIGAHFKGQLKTYGAPTNEIFKGKRSEESGDWYDYVLEFGPGVFMKYSVRVDETGKVAGLSIG